MKFGFKKPRGIGPSMFILIGLALVTWGLYLIYIPAAPIFAGLVLAAEGMTASNGKENDA